MDDRLALCREHWDILNMANDLFGIGFDMLFHDLYKLMVSKATFVGLSVGGDRPNRSPLDPPLLQNWF